MQRRARHQRSKRQRVAPFGSGGDAEGGMEGESVDVPGRRPGARGAVGSRERVALDFSRPSTRTIQARHFLQRWSIGHSGRVALKTRSMPSSLTEIVQAGFAARLRDLRVSGPLTI